MLLSSQSQECVTEPERDPQQEEQPDAAEGKVIADYNSDIEYEGSELENELVAQE